jgi:CheY-like chemotaxis protein
VDGRLLRAVIESAGHDVVFFSSAGDALEQIIAQRPDVMLVDLNLPGMDGFELVRALRAYENASAVPVVAMTAYPHRYTSRQAFLAGCSAWIVKPFGTRTLNDRLLALCAIGRAGARE